MCTTFDKPFKNYEQLIEIMENRHIVVNDKDFAKMALQNFSYYSIVNGYKDTFLQIPGSDDFIPGTKFEELYTIHMLDVSLNNIIFKYILYIEKALKSRISYLVSEQFGVYTDRSDMTNNNPSDYLYRKNYSSSSGKRNSILCQIKECANNERGNPVLHHYITTKNHVPAWILTSNVPFGLTIEWYNILKGTDKQTICEQFIDNAALTVEERKEFLHKALSLCKEYRNKIAHGNRTFSIMQLPELPKKATLLLSMGTLTEPEYTLYGQNSIFAVFLAIVILLNDQYLLINFHTEIKSLLEPYHDTKFNHKNIYEIFGLPNDTISRIQKLLYAKFT